jgi:ribosome-associated heat shock protein Hsp15
MQMDVESIRLDKWLWVARFFKTRKLATEAIAGGKVHINGQRTKPGKEIKTGAEVAINKDRVLREVTIMALSSRRLPAKDAVQLYEESPESLERRRVQLAEQKEQHLLFGFNNESKKPNKKDRRLIHRFRQAEDT